MANQAELTPLTHSEKGDLGRCPESKHTSSCVVKAVLAGRVHGGILADCLTAAGNGLNPCVSWS